MGIETVHQNELPVTTMVLNRLPFLGATEANYSVISNFIQEVCWELEPCLKIRLYKNNVGEEISDTERVADEENYTQSQKTLIADMVALYILMQFALGVSPVSESEGGTSSGSSGGAATFLKKAVAGSVQVEYDLVSSEASGTSFYDKLKVDSLEMLNMYKKRVNDKALLFGCVLSICEDCFSTENMGTGGLPFIVVSKNGDCGCR